MKLAELRIGNWVRTAIPGDTVLIPCSDMEVTGIDVFTGATFNNLDPHNNSGFSIDAKHVIGIPLTEEWLMKFGFVKNNQNRWQIPGHFYAIYWYSYQATGDDHQMWRIEYQDPYSKEGYLDCHQMVDRIPYVHLLQNLYFFLVGEELTIKP